ncbi:hypothetical protein [Nocardia fluminea]|uniref:hypothetical protein n=1 Tax=Nocardia fluminea TaxID=134984 RepID=UPI0033EDECAC
MSTPFEPGASGAVLVPDSGPDFVVVVDVLATVVDSSEELAANPTATATPITSMTTTAITAMIVPEPPPRRGGGE